MTVLFKNDKGIPVEVLDNVISLEGKEIPDGFIEYSVRYMDYDRSGREYVNKKYITTKTIEVLPKVEAKISAGLINKENLDG